MRKATTYKSCPRTTPCLCRTVGTWILACIAIGPTFAEVSRRHHELWAYVLLSVANTLPYAHSHAGMLSHKVVSVGLGHLQPPPPKRKGSR